MTLALDAPLSADTDKLRRYVEEDLYFSESLEQLSALVEDPVAFAHQHAILLCKPDAVIGRRLQPCLQWLAANDFRIVAARCGRPDRHLARALWTQPWRHASRERRILADLLCGLADALVLVLTPGTDTVAATAALTAAKGPADPRARTPGQLRETLGDFGYLLNLVHTPDDSADLIRELAIYFDELTRTHVITEALTGRDRSAEAEALIGELYDRTPVRSLHFDDAADALEHWARQRIKQADNGFADAVRVAWDAAGNDRSARLAAVLRLAYQHDETPDPWDSIVVGSAVLPMVRTASARGVGVS